MLDCPFSPSKEAKSPKHEVVLALDVRMLQHCPDNSSRGPPCAV